MFGGNYRGVVRHGSPHTNLTHGNNVVFQAPNQPVKKKPFTELPVHGKHLNPNARYSDSESGCHTDSLYCGAQAVRRV